MANKKVLVGVQDANGNIVPQPWVASDVVTDQDGAALYSSANPPPGGWQTLGTAAANATIVGNGSLQTNTLINVTYPVGTKEIRIDSTFTYGSGPVDTAAALIDLISGGNELRGVNGMAVAAFTQVTLTPPAVIMNSSSDGLQILAFNATTRNLQIQARFTMNFMTGYFAIFLTYKG